LIILLILEEERKLWSYWFTSVPLFRYSDLRKSTHHSPWLISVLIIFFISLSGVRLSPLDTVANTGLFYQPQLTDNGNCRAIGGMKTGSENRSTRRKPSPVPLCPQQIPHDLTRAQTRAAAVGIQRLTAWAMARPEYSYLDHWLDRQVS
jgi:hypothetical protein